MSDVTLFVVLVVVLLAVVILLPQLLLRAAIPKVVRILREHDATNADSAVLAQDVGLPSASFVERSFKPRDYKPKALLGLIQLEIVHVTDDGRVYLDEAALSGSPFRDQPSN